MSTDKRTQSGTEHGARAPHGRAGRGRVAEFLRGAAVPVVVGLLARLIALAFASDIRCLLDECGYQQLTQDLLNGQGYRPYRGHLWAPGYVGFLALHGFARPDLALAAKFTQVFLSTATQVLLFVLVRQIHGRKVAMGTSWLFALYPTLIAFTHYLWPETLYLFAYAAATLLLFSFRRQIERSARAHYGLIATAGFVYGLSCLIKPAPLYFLPILLLWLVLTTRPRQLSGAAALVFLISTSVPILPWTARNYLEYERFLLIDATGGMTLWHGNSLVPPRISDFGMKRPLVMSYPRCREENIVDRDRCDTRRAAQSILNDPVRFISRIPTKMADLWSPNSFLIRHVRLNIYGKASRFVIGSISLVATLTYALILVAAVLGLALHQQGENVEEKAALKTYVLSMVAYYILLHSLVFGLSRFRLPLMPFLMPFAALAWLKRYELPSLLRRPLLLIPTVLVLLLLFLGWSQRLGPLLDFAVKA
jgi:hypothetical protein